jgi:uncharacterized protein
MVIAQWLARLSRAAKYVLAIGLVSAVGSAAVALVAVKPPLRLIAPTSAAVQQLTSNLPVLTGRVVDLANLIPVEVETQLTAKLAALESDTTDQVVVVTVPSLNNETIETFGLRLGNSWRVGQTNVNNGVLFIVAPTERKVRIEVGLGLENILTDDMSARIIQNEILPAFKAAKMLDGIVAGTDRIDAVLRADPNRPATVKLKGQME